MFTLFIGFTIIMGCVFSGRHSLARWNMRFFPLVSCLLPLHYPSSYHQAFLSSKYMGSFDVFFHFTYCAHSAIKSQAILFALCSTFWSNVPNAPLSIFTDSSLFWSLWWLPICCLICCEHLSKFHHLSLSDFCISIYSFLWLTNIKSYRYIDFFFFWWGVGVGRKAYCTGILLWLRGLSV